MRSAALIIASCIIPEKTKASAVIKMHRGRPAWMLNYSPGPT